jgi:histidinol phosphatase-like PHP family hydrolase
LPLSQFAILAQYARRKGIKIIVAHGETLAEPVMKGTNRAALEADIDILAHPGLISDEDIKLARREGIFLEITSRHGHCDANGHVIERALKLGAKLILNTDSHAPEDIISPEELIKTGLRFGLSKEEVNKIFKDIKRLIV